VCHDFFAANPALHSSPSTQRACLQLTVQQVITVQILPTVLPHPHVLLPKMQALRKALQKAHVCKRVRALHVLHSISSHPLRTRGLARMPCCLIPHQAPQSCDLVYYKLVEWMQASRRQRRCTRARVQRVQSTASFILYVLTLAPGGYCETFCGVSRHVTVVSSSSLCSSTDPSIHPFNSCF